jgi:hypothetical protein
MNFMNVTIQENLDMPFDKCKRNYILLCRMARFNP